MGRMSKQKGARGEREVAALLQPVVDAVAAHFGVCSVDVRRTGYLQARKGGDDLMGVEWASIEVKRHEKVIPSLMRKWWMQTCGQATHGRTPILIWRKSHQPWRARVRACECVQDFEWQEFLEWFARAHEIWIVDSREATSITSRPSFANRCETNHAE